MLKSTTECGKIENPSDNLGLERFNNKHDTEEKTHENESLSLVFSITSGDSSQKRWRRLPVSEDDYLDDGDDLNPDGIYEGSENVAVSNRRLRLLGGCAVFIAVLALLIPKSTEKNRVHFSEPYASKKIKGTPQYTCPVVGEQNETVNRITNTNSYDPIVTEKSQAFATHVGLNLEEYIETFRDKGYDQWNGSKTFNEIKDDLRTWKTSKFLDNLKTGDSIYQSGSGVALDLVLTLELLGEENEAHYVTDLHVYGNDYIPKTAEVANLMLDNLATKAGSKRGVICAADSTSLNQFVPEDSFDLVYTSCIPPLYDPLALNTWNNDTDTTKAHYRELCVRKSKPDWKAETLRRLAQERQDEWYSQWVAEMIRIAKPGAPVIVEYVGQPFCPDSGFDDDDFSLVGVSKDFWTRSIALYGWEVDPESIEMESDQLFPSTYHVFMRKRDCN